MRRVAFSTLVCMLAVLGGPLGAPAQPGLSRVSDAKGVFSIGLPAGWRIADTRISDTVFAGLRRSRLADHVISKLAAHSSADDAVGPAILMVVALDLPEQVTAVQFGQILKGRAPADWRVTGDGAARIAGRDAYYAYFTSQQTVSAVYMLMAYFTVGRTGFVVVGATYNQPAAIQKHFATISRILETFRPGAAFGGVTP